SPIAPQEMNFAVLQFPASNCDQDALHALRDVLGQSARYVWHKDTSLGDADAVVVPGGFSYGDYLRCGAIARFSPVMQAVQQFAAHGGLVLGICNGFQVLCEAGLLPGALLPNTTLRFVCRQVSVEVADARTPWTSATERGDVLSIPAKHTTGRYWAPDAVGVELAIFSLMWSEHCGYKHSRRVLKTLPTEGGRLLLGPGENAGAVAVGENLACAFKVESHNHPSAVEPFEGAATGVGGILRDVFAVGARPVAVLDSLRFGEPTSERSRYLLDHAVAGTGHYGNSIGVATVGGEVYFEGPYETNCLVNAMCVGLIERERLIRSAAAGVGNL